MMVSAIFRRAASAAGGHAGVVQASALAAGPAGAWDESTSESAEARGILEQARK